MPISEITYRAFSGDKRPEIIDAPVVYIIGDSHVSAFSGKDEVDLGFPNITASAYHNVYICRLGATLAASLGNVNSTEGGRRKAFALIPHLLPSSIVLLSFGEIDCRVHIPKRANFKEERLDESVGTAVENYVSFIRDFSLAVTFKGIKVGVLSPPPTATFDMDKKKGIIFNFLRKTNNSIFSKVTFRILKNFMPRHTRMWLGNALAPEYADNWEIRNQSLMAFSKKIKNFCSENQMIYIDMFTDFIDENGRSHPKWFMDEIHLSSRIIPIISPKFSNYGIENFSEGLKSSILNIE
jgi:hypothetical protein